MTGSSCNRIMLGLVVGFLFSSHAHAENLDGAWANDVQVCSKIFEKKNNKISLRRNADFYGSGFIIAGKEVKGMLGSCKIISHEQDGDKMLLKAQCVTDMSTSSNQFGLRVDGNDKLTRFYPDMPDMKMDYSRCPPIN
jgi:hypothetical protein